MFFSTCVLVVLVLAALSAATKTTKTKTKKTGKSRKHVDWRKRGAVTPVADELGCDASWAFATLAALEAQYFRKTGQLVQFSAQQLVDCVTANDGCHGGSLLNAFKYIVERKGLALDEDYEFRASEQPHCQAEADMEMTVRLTGVVKVFGDNETALADAVANNGPVAVTLDCAYTDDFLE